MDLVYFDYDSDQFDVGGFLHIDEFSVSYYVHEDLEMYKYVVPEIDEIIQSLPISLTVYLKEVMILDMAGAHGFQINAVFPQRIHLSTYIFDFYDEDMIKRIIAHELSHVLFSMDTVWHEVIMEAYELEPIPATSYSLKMHLQHEEGFNPTEEFAECVSAYLHKNEEFGITHPIKFGAVRDNVINWEP